ncbi:unnamed protein product, partial [Ilex paraguariensis]
IVTNGVYHSIEHRVTVNSEKERISIATFLNPKFDGDLRPTPSLNMDQKPALFKRMSVVECYRGLFSCGISGKSYLDVMRPISIKKLEFFLGYE